jgi:hypothetical protein
MTLYVDLRERNEEIERERRKKKKRRCGNRSRWTLV